MTVSTLSVWPPRLMTFLLSSLAAASIVFWVIKWPVPSSPLHAPVAASAAHLVDINRMALLLGANVKPPAAATQTNGSVQSNFKLLGVIARGTVGKQDKWGSALISFNGQLARPYRVGQSVPDNWVLQSVTPHGAVLVGNGQLKSSQPMLQLELPVPSVNALKSTKTP